MRRLISAFIVCVLGIALSACHPGPVLVKSEVSVGGTIAGVVHATNGTLALSGRKVMATDVATGGVYQTTTNVTGGYTVKVPEGTYHLDVETRGSEMVGKRPADTHVRNGDLDAGRDFDVSIATARR